MSGIGAGNSRKKRRNKKRGAVNTVYSTVAPAYIVSAICDMSGNAPFGFPRLLSASCLRL